MTEQKAIKHLENHLRYLKENWKPHPDYDVLESISMAISALEAEQRYRAIGTVEECRAAVEKQNGKRPIEKEMPYSEVTGFNSEWHCPCCGSYIGFFTEGMSEPEQMEYCNNCGQHIAKAWSEEE